MNQLTTRHVQARRIDNALSELLTNARRVVLAGHAPQALEALTLLLQPDGVWRLPAHGALVTQAQGLLPVAALLAEQGCPAVGEQEAMASPQLDDWAMERAQQQLRQLVRLDHEPAGAAGEGWSPDFLATLVQRRSGAHEPHPHLAFGAFCRDAELVLKDRLAQLFEASHAGVDDIPTVEDLLALGLPEDEVATILEQLQSAGQITVAPAARATDTLVIARAVADYLRSTGFGGGHTAHTLWQACWLLLAQEGRGHDAIEVATAWLTHDEPAAAAALLEWTVVPATARLLRAGHLAHAVGVDVDAVSRWRAELGRRPAFASAPPAAVAGTPSESREAWRNLMEGTPLAVLDWLPLPIPGHGAAASGEIAWAAQVPVEERQTLWHAARALVESRTARWPVVTTLWSGATDTSEVDALAHELFTRFPYEQGGARDDVSPRYIVAGARGIDAEELLVELAESAVPLNDAEQFAVWYGELAAAGVPAAGLEAAWAECAGDRLRFERWLASLESTHGVDDPARGRQECFVPDNAWLVLLPTPHAEEALAYLHWYAMERGSAEDFIALLRRWRERHGAELWAHYGTMLEFEVSEPPQNMDSALALAREHDLAAPCTLALPGIPLRHHALGLVGHNTWFLHERP